jgi:hypothetical protein
MSRLAGQRFGQLVALACAAPLALSHPALAAGGEGDIVDYAASERSGRDLLRLEEEASFRAVPVAPGQRQGFGVIAGGGGAAIRVMRPVPVDALRPGHAREAGSAGRSAREALERQSISVIGYGAARVPGQAVPAIQDGGSGTPAGTAQPDAPADIPNR